MLHQNVLTLIGDTPLVDVSGLAPHPGVRLLAKLEGHNPFGSLKDRIARTMIERAAAAGELAPGQRILAPSSGNTGISLAGIGCVTGHPVTVVMPADASPERIQTLVSLGADLILTPAVMQSSGAIRRAEQLAEEHPEWCFLNQYDDDANPVVHFDSTGPEVWRDAPGITHFVAGIGSGGTILGVGRFLKERNPHVEVVAAEPAHGRRIEGVRSLADGFVPPVFNRWCGGELVDRTMLVDRDRALRMTELLARACGVFAGPSSGMALAAAVDVAAGIDRGAVVFLACDGGWKYLSERGAERPRTEAIERRLQPGTFS